MDRAELKKARAWASFTGRPANAFMLGCVADLWTRSQRWAWLRHLTGECVDLTSCVVLHGWLQQVVRAGFARLVLQHFLFTSQFVALLQTWEPW